jgi:hypothetical protein
MFQNVGATALARGQVEPPVSDALQQVADLISRYPNLSEIELARLINLYRQLSALDAALMISDEHVGPRLDAFWRDHRSSLRPPFRQYGVLVGIAIVGIAVVFWSVAFG